MNYGKITAMKKTHRFLVPEIPALDSFPVTDERIVFQIGNVLVMKPAEEFILFTDGGDDEVVEITSIEKTVIKVKKKRTINVRTNSLYWLVAAVGIPKGTKFETIVQKLTEVGVSHIVPIISTRTVKEGVRIDRLQAISDEALEQCGGNKRVTIHEPMSLAESLTQFPYPSMVFTPEGESLITSRRSTSMVMYIGPEGGWDATDWKLFQEANATTASLGQRILRTETAAAIGAYQLLWGLY